MKRIVPSWPPEPRTLESKRIAQLYAGLLVVMTTAQLFRFDQFVPLVSSFELPGQITGQVTAALLVTCGVFAQPFLLRMKLSLAMRWLSMLAGWFVALGWLVVSLWINITGVVIMNAGLLGTTIELPAGWWMVLFSIGLCLLSAWASWGLWPGKRTSLEHSRKK